MGKPLIVEDSHFEYLRLQKGKLDRLSGDRAEWHAAYEQSLENDYYSFAPYLPFKCRSILDVGGGLGGIDVYLVRRYGRGCSVTILDGESDPPRMDLHCRTFNHMGVTRDFLVKNGVEKFSYFTPEQKSPRPFDLIVSFGSWCFHYPPSEYLDFVQACCRRGTHLILDVRVGKHEWYEQLGRAFTMVGIAKETAKWMRVVFRA